MENLTSLMRSLDDISSLIPEGTYLEMANNLKKVHETIPKDTDPPMLDLRSLPVNVPFQVVQPGMAVHRLQNDEDSDDDEDEDEVVQRVPTTAIIEIDTRSEIRTEFHQNNIIIERLKADIRIAERSLRLLKPIINLTPKIKEAAIMDFCDGDPDCVGGGEWTFDNLNAATVWSSEEERRECTSKMYERTLYNNYKIKENRRISRLTIEARELKRNLEIELEDYKDRQAYLTRTYL